MAGHRREKQRKADAAENAWIIGVFCRWARLRSPKNPRRRENSPRRKRSQDLTVSNP